MPAPSDILFARLEVLTWRLLQGEDNDPARLLSTTAQLMDLAPSMPTDLQERLLAGLARAQEAVSTAQQRLASRLDALPTERRAMRGYVQHNNARPVTGRVSRHI